MPDRSGRLLMSIDGTSLAMPLTSNGVHPRYRIEHTRKRGFLPALLYWQAGRRSLAPSRVRHGYGGDGEGDRAVVGAGVAQGCAARGGGDLQGTGGAPVGP